MRLYARGEPASECACTLERAARNGKEANRQLLKLDLSLARYPAKSIKSRTFLRGAAWIKATQSSVLWHP
jgi:hypothetical protein